LSAALVIGSGPDELVVARALLRAGHTVTVVEEHAAEKAPLGWVPAQVARGLTRLRVERPDPWLAVALPSGGTLQLWHDMARSVEAIRRISPGDAARWPQFSERMARLARLLADLYLRPAPELVDLRFALKVRRLGRQGMEDLMRVLPMPVAEWLDDWFESDALKGALGALGIAHLEQGPRSGGTAFRLLHHHVGCPPGVFRPTRSNIGDALRSRVGIRPAKLRRILVKRGGAVGVVLDGGEEIAASLVVSGAGPRRTLLELLEPGSLDPQLARAVRNVRARGVVARIRFEEPPAVKNLVVAPSLDYLERAYDDAKYGRVSKAPYLELASDGQASFQFAPYRLCDGAWDDARRRAVGDAAARILGDFLPRLAVRDVEVPFDLEQTAGWPQGQAHHAELALDQALWMRPVPELARYRTPIAGLWLCGPGMHPGPGILGASGYNCARAILSTLHA
jgi:phytoene dehydrogenase-like protein